MRSFSQELVDSYFYPPFIALSWANFLSRFVVIIPDSDTVQRVVCCTVAPRPPQ